MEVAMNLRRRSLVLVLASLLTACATSAQRATSSPQDSVPAFATVDTHVDIPAGYMREPREIERKPPIEIQRGRSQAIRPHHYSKLSLI